MIGDRSSVMRDERANAALVELRPESLLRRLGPAGVMSIVAAVLPFVGNAAVIWWLSEIAPWVRSHALLGMAVYVVSFWVLGGTAFLSTFVQSAAGGYIFGFAVGLPLALVSFVGAALVSYGIARRASGEGVTQLIGENPRWQAVYDALLGGGFGQTFSVITLLRLSASPFAMTNVVMAAVRARVMPFVLSVAGLVPRTAFMVYTGSLFGGKSVAEFLTGLREPRQLWMMALSLGSAAMVIVVIGLMAKRAVGRTIATEDTGGTE